MYTRGVNSSYCQHSCMSARCNDGDNQIKGEIFVIDSAREKRMGYGRKWKYGKIPPGQVILHVDTAAALNVEVGDTIFLRFTEHLLLRFAFAPEPEPPGTAPRSGALPTPTEGMPRSPDYAWPLRTLFHAQVALSVKVFAITGADGKIGNKIQNPLFMECVANGGTRHALCPHSWCAAAACTGWNTFCRGWHHGCTRLCVTSLVWRLQPTRT